MLKNAYNSKMNKVKPLRRNALSIAHPNEKHCFLSQKQQPNPCTVMTVNIIHNMQATVRTLQSEKYFQAQKRRSKVVVTTLYLDNLILNGISESIYS